VAKATRFFVRCWFLLPQRTKKRVSACGFRFYLLDHQGMKVTVFRGNRPNCMAGAQWKQEGGQAFLIPEQQLGIDSRASLCYDGAQTEPRLE
jgi:hypothetical protein